MMIAHETLKHTGEYPIISVNTFLSSAPSPKRNGA